MEHGAPPNRTTSTSFPSVVEQKAHEAAAAPIERLTTVYDKVEGFSGIEIGNGWSRRHYGGAFRLATSEPGETAVSLVFVQTSEGNTGSANPSALGGGATDKHLIYEGLSRVAADAVLSGAGSLHRGAFFSVWHPQLVSLRTSLGLPRHPAQVIVSKSGRFDFDTLLFNVPDVPVFLLAGDECARRHAAAIEARPWVRLVRIAGDELRSAIDELRITEGIQRISAIGGRFTATHLVDQGLVQDICLTTTAQAGGEPDTPWYTGATPPTLALITRKQWNEDGSMVVFDHLSID